MSSFAIGDRGLGAAGDTHPDWMMAHATTGPILVAGASAIGQIHLAHGMPRDDAFMIKSVGPWLAVAVSDGVGSRPMSRFGSTYVVDALTSLLLHLASPATPKDHDAPEVKINEKPARRDSPSFESEDNLLELYVPSFELDAKDAAKQIVTGPEEAALKQFVAQLQSADAEEAGIIARWFNGVSRLWWRKRSRAVTPKLQPWPSERIQQVASVGWSLLRQAPQEPERTKMTTTLDLEQPDPIPKGQEAPGSVRPDLVDLMKEAYRKAHIGLRDHAKRLELDLTDLSCTALALLLNCKTGQIAVGQVGDGAVLGLTLKGNVRELVTPPDTSDPQTVYTVNRPDFEKYLTIQSVAPPQADPLVGLYVMTDGLSGDLLYSSESSKLLEWAKDVNRNLRHSATPAQAASGMLNWLAGYQVPGSWDDRTLVVVTVLERENGGN